MKGTALKILKDRITLIAVAVIIFAGITGGSFYLGYASGAKNPQIFQVQELNNAVSADAPSNFGLFWEAWQNMKNKAVDIEKTDNKNLVYGAISGLVESLGDPNSNFFPPTDAKQFNDQIKGEFSGIGAEIGNKNGILSVVAPLKDSPAERAGLKSGDQIIKIDDADSATMKSEDAVKLIRGEKGTVVKLTIAREGLKDGKVIAIIRDTIQVPTIDFKMKDGIAYFHLYNFYETAPYAFYQAVVKASVQNPKGVIFDVRDNPGGYLDVAENIAGWFLNQGDVVVKEKFRGDQTNEFKANGAGTFKNTPVVVLMNQGSASASEITAGYLRDIRGAKLVGTKSYGKGTVQEVVNLSDGSMMKITIAHWLTPSGTLIDKNGLIPDYEVGITDDDLKAGRDPQLDKAMEIIRQEVADNKDKGRNIFIQL
ncbi:MAG: S41 family peptidase [Candidatus Wolfebacteria bacterium]|nr:S41 family peptidase [Candidatus Wolfebacteria bacterium]